MIPGESLDPVVVLDGPLPQDFLGNGAGAMHAAEEVYDVLWTGQERQVAEDDDTVESGMQMPARHQTVWQILRSVFFLPCA